MLHAFSRFEMLVGHEAMEKLAASKVAVFGVGGVGSFVVKGLAKRNRQICACGRRFNLPDQHQQADPRHQKNGGTPEGRCNEGEDS